VPEKTSQLIMRLMHDLRALDANVRVLAQQIRAIKKNERILARNLILLSRKVAELKETAGRSSGVDEEKIRQLMDMITHTREDIAKLREDVEYLKRQLHHTLTSEDIAELKYIVETVNPLEFVTYKQIGELVEKKLRELGIIQ